MKRNRAVGIIASVVVVCPFLLAAVVVCAYLTEYGARRIVLAAVVAALGAGLAGLVYRFVSRRCTSKRRTIVVISLLIILIAAALISTVYPGKITYARFGLTVYGIIPVPVLDITVGPRGCLWFRDKSHHISIEEVERLLSPDVEVLVIGIGWHSLVEVDAAVRNIDGVEVHVLPTPDAFDLFNRCVSEGKTAVLIAHSTC